MCVGVVSVWVGVVSVCVGVVSVCVGVVSVWTGVVTTCVCVELVVVVVVVVVVWVPLGWWWWWCFVPGCLVPCFVVFVCVADVCVRVRVVVVCVVWVRVTVTLSPGTAAPGCGAVTGDADEAIGTTGASEACWRGGADVDLTPSPRPNATPNGTATAAPRSSHRRRADPACGAPLSLPSTLDMVPALSRRSGRFAYEAGAVWTTRSPSSWKVPRRLAPSL